MLFVLSETRMPPVGATPLRVTVPVEESPPMTLDGLTVTEVKLGGTGVTVSVAFLITPL